MLLKLKNFKTQSPWTSWIAVAILASGSGCAKLAFDPNATENEAEKIKKAGVEVSPPAVSAPLIVAPVGNPTSPVSVARAPEESPPSATDDQAIPSASTPETKVNDQAPTSDSPESSTEESDSPARSTEEGDTSTSTTGDDSREPGESEESREHPSKHASESGQEHADEHAAHQRSRVRISHDYSRTFRAKVDLALEDITAALPKLPYASSREHAMVTLQIRRANDTRLKPVPHVVNSQVIFGVDITDLPSETRLPQATEVTLSLSLTRVSIRNRADTELLCLIDITRCSGRAIQAASWQTNKNPHFWSQTDLIRSATFADLKPGTDVPFARSHALNQGTIHLNLLEALGADTLAEIRKIPLNRDGKRILLITVSDDTLVHDAALTVSGQETSDITVPSERAEQP